MTDDSNKPGGAGDDDPLSALFDLDDDNLDPKKESDDGDPFDQKTVTLGPTAEGDEALSGDDNQTEFAVLSEEASDDDAKTLDSLLDEAFSEDLVGDDETQVLASTSSSSEQSHSINDETINDETIDEAVIPEAEASFFSEDDGATELNASEGEENPFADNPDDKTIMLSKAAQEVMGEEPPSESTSAEPGPPPSAPSLEDNDATQMDGEDFDPIEAALGDSESTLDEEAKQPVASSSAVDPVDEALAAFVDGDKDFDLSVQEEQASAPRPTSEASLDEGPSSSPPPAESAKEAVADEDFADVFDPGPIQVAEAKEAKAKKLSKLPLLKISAIAASLLIVFGGLGTTYHFLSQDEGLLGYRLDGFSLAKAYRAPDAQTQMAFKKIFEEVEKAHQSYDIVKIEQSLPDLKGILQKDERNFQAAGLLLESYGILLRWKGLSGELPKLFEAMANRIPSIAQKLETSQNYSPVHRAYAFRTWALGNAQKASSELSDKLKETKTPDENTFLLLAELALDQNDAEDAQRWLKRINTIETKRLEFARARAEGDDQKIASLKTEGYLPAAVAFETSQKLTLENASAAEVRAETLLEKVKDYPFLALKVRSRQGDVYQKLDQSEKARERWQAVLKLNPKDADTWRKLAASYEGDNMWDEALEAYATAEKGGSLNKDLKIRYADLLIVRGKIVEALTVLDKAIKEHPDTARLYYEKGQAQLSIYQEDAAKQSFLKALEVDPNYELANLSLGQLALDQRLWSAAENYFKKIGSKSSNYGLALFHRGLLSADKKEYPEAIRLLEKANEIDPRMGKLYPTLVELYLRNERVQKAQALVTRGENFIREDIFLNIAKGKLLKFNRDYDKALETLEPFLKSHDHILEVYFVMADALIEDQRSDEAMSLLNRLVAKEVRSGELDYLRAKAIVRDQRRGETLIGSIDLAAKLIASALRKKPDNPDYRVLAAEIARKNEDRFLAFEHVDHVLETQPKYPWAHMVKGDIYIDNGDFQAAIQSYTTGVGNTRFKGRFYHRLAKAHRLNGSIKDAIRYYRRVLRTQAKDARAHLELGKLYNEQGRFPLALRHLQKAVSLNPRLSESFYYLGFINKEVGNDRSAIKNFERFLALEPGGIESSTVKDEIFFLKQGRSSQN